jgi:hypothetical protein
MQTTTFRHIAATAAISLALPLAGFGQSGAATSGDVNGNGSASASRTNQAADQTAGSSAVSGTMQTPKDTSAPDPSGHFGTTKNGQNQNDASNGANSSSATDANSSANPPGSTGNNPGNPTNPSSSSGQGAASK